MPTLTDVLDHRITSAIDCLSACAQDYAAHCDKTLAKACRKAAADLRAMQVEHGITKSS